jgi:hypothetical protein
MMVVHADTSSVKLDSSTEFCLRKKSNFLNSTIEVLQAQLRVSEKNDKQKQYLQAPGNGITR